MGVILSCLVSLSLLKLDRADHEIREGNHDEDNQEFQIKVVPQQEQEQGERTSGDGDGNTHVYAIEGGGVVSCQPVGTCNWKQDDRNQSEKADSSEIEHDIGKYGRGDTKGDQVRKRIKFLSKWALCIEKSCDSAVISVNNAGTKNK